MSDTSAMLRTSEVARRLNVSTKTVLRMVEGGDLIATRLSARTIRFDASYIDSLSERAS